MNVDCVLQVNPYAKLTDWVFGLVAMAILGNIVLIATVGVSWLTTLWNFFVGTIFIVQISGLDVLVHTRMLTNQFFLCVCRCGCIKICINAHLVKDEVLPEPLFTKLENREGGDTENENSYTGDNNVQMCTAVESLLKPLSVLWWWNLTTIFASTLCLGLIFLLLTMWNETVTLLYVFLVRLLQWPNDIFIFFGWDYWRFQENFNPRCSVIFPNLDNILQFFKVEIMKCLYMTVDFLWMNRKMLRLPLVVTL